MKQSIYVIGHKNPDTDSIASAIAYADIKNKLAGAGPDPATYIPARAGQINEETEFVLKYFDVDAPIYLADVGTQVRDMEIRRTPGVSRDTPIRKAWRRMKATEAVTLPVTNEDGHLEGLVTTGDIAKTYMEAQDSRLLARAETRIGSIAETIGGRVIVGDEQTVIKSGKIIIGAAHPDTMEDYLEKGDVVILGNRHEDHLRAVEQDPACMIICVGSGVKDDIRKAAEEKGCIIITTDEDTFTVARSINLSIPLTFIMRKEEELITFKTDEYTEDIKEVMATTRHRAFPVLDKTGVYAGTISRRNFLGMQKKQLILVDHNEKSQAVDSVEEAQVLEIVDHHRIGALETIEPIYFRNQPVGCTATIMSEIYEEKDLEIPDKIAGILCAAIVSDTLMFRSPTCTPVDEKTAKMLAGKIGLDIENFSGRMFHAGSNLLGKPLEEVFFQDFKKFIAGDKNFGVGQISSFDEAELKKLQERLQPFMEKQRLEHGMDMIFYMLTNILDGSTGIICAGEGSSRLIEEAFDVTGAGGSYVLENVVSRKKQLIPALMNTIQEDQ